MAWQDPKEEGFDAYRLLVDWVGRARAATDEAEARLGRWLTPPVQMWRRARSLLSPMAPAGRLLPAPEDGRLRIASAVTPATAAALAPDCELLEVTPADFAEVLGKQRPDVLLVEACGAGEGASFRMETPLQRLLFGQLEELLRLCDQNGVPTVFWNTEDPSGFERFLPVAGMFEFVFTTDANLIPEYQQRLRHERVFALPFASQPWLHHPVQSGPRSGTVCYAGSFPGEHPGLRAALEGMLGAAAEFGLDIFDSQQGEIGLATLTRRFPLRFRSFLRGRLDYPGMVEAYRRYRVFLNVNPAADSPTVLSRRVFELLACGTPVLSTPSFGLEHLLGCDAVVPVESTAQVRSQLMRLLSDDEHWARRALLGLRRVLQGHTIRDRLRALWSAVGLSWTQPEDERFGCLVPIRDRRDLKWWGATLDRQLRLPETVWILGEPICNQNDLDVLRVRFPEIEVIGLPANLEPARLLDAVREQAVDRLVCFRPGHYYGPNFLLDYSLACRFSDAEVFGKASHYLAAAGGDVHLEHAGQEYRQVPAVPAPTAAVRLEVLSPEVLSGLLQGESISVPQGSCLSLDHFGFVAGPPAGGWRKVLSKPFVSVDV